MELAQVIWIIIQFIIGYNLVLPFLFFVIWKLFVQKQNSYKSDGNVQADYAIIVTAYEQTDNLSSVVSSIQQLDYSNYMIYIVADKCDISNLNFDDQRVILLRPAETIASNTGSHLYAVNHFIRNHDRITIIDSDNLVDADYLNALNNYFDKGYKAVQGIRCAKNIDTTFSRLDAARDIYYHFYDGQILYELGSSSTLSGSGMAFEINLYKEFLEKHNIKGAGFDKILQAFILKKNLRIAFTDKAIVYDEKTSQSDQLVKQRARWINTWFKYFNFGFSLIGKGIRNLSLNQFLFGLVLLRPPLFIFILLSAMFLFINLLTLNFITVGIWIIAMFLFVAGFMLALANSDTDSRIYKSLKDIPKFIFYQILSLLKSRNANKHSISTKHYHNKDIEQLNSYRTHEDNTR